MPISKRRLIDQLAASPEEREINGEFLFEGAGEILAALRKKLGLSLADVAGRLQLAKTTVMRYENNDVPLSDYAVGRFAEVYDVDAEELMLECMLKVLPAMKDSPFAKLIAKKL